MSDPITNLVLRSGVGPGQSPSAIVLHSFAPLGGILPSSGGGLSFFDGLTAFTGLTAFDGLTLFRGVTRYIPGTISEDPIITSDGGGDTASVDVSSPDTDVTTVTATGTAPVTFMLSGGDDVALFQIDAADGTLTFVDPSVDGTYEVIVAAVNLGGVDTQKVTVTVTTPYHADAVHFDGNASLAIASLTAGTDPYLSVVFWIKGNPQDGKKIYVSDYSGNYTSIGDTDLLGNVHVSIGNSAGSHYVSEYTDEGIIVALDNTWHCIIATMNGTTADEKIYCGDVDATELDLTFHPLVPVFNALPFIFGDDSFGNGITCDFADVRFYPGLSFLSAGDIPLATRRLFIDASGKPVDPAVATAALGQTGAILFSGDSTTFGTNQGTGGAFTLTGSLTNASTSPSD